MRPLARMTGVDRGRSLVAAIVLALLPVCSLAGAEERRNVRFRTIGPREGLMQAGVKVMWQDRLGYLWLGTEDALHRYDGYDFTVYSHDASDPSSLSHGGVRSIYEDGEGVLWIGTDGGGLNRLDPSTGEFLHFRHDPEDPTSLSHDWVRVVIGDGAGGLWIGTDGGGLNRFDPESGTFVRFVHREGDPSSLGGNHVRALYREPGGRLWVATDGGGVDVLDPEVGSFLHYRHDPADPKSLASDQVLALIPDGRGGLWIGTNGAGLDRLEIEEGEITHYRHDPSRPDSLADDTVRSLLRDSSGSLWVGTDHGLCRWLADSERFERYRHDPTDPWSLSHDTVISLFEDRGGVLWVGTYGGLDRWNTGSGYFLHYRHETRGPTRLSNNYVTSFAEDPSGDMWIGTLGGGLNRFDPETHTFVHFRHDPQDPGSLSDDRVMSLRVDSEGELWVGTRSGGLNRLDRESGRFTKFRHSADDPQSLSGDGVTAIYEDRRGTLWIGTYRGGLNRFERGEGRFHRYTSSDSDPFGLSNDRVVTLLEDSGGALWVGTDGGGLNRLDRESGRFRHYLHDPDDPSSLSSNHIRSLIEDRWGNLWIGTQGGGLNRWSVGDRRQGHPHFDHYGKKEGFLTDVIYASLLDEDGRLWLSSNRGLARFDRASEEIKWFNTSHGLQSEEFNFGAAFRASDGEMFFGGINGFNSFYPRLVRDNVHPPPVVITQILKFNRPVLADRVIPESPRVELDYKDYVVAFEFAALDYTDPAQNQYRYKLEGLDGEWVDAGTVRRASYTNLAPGSYAFLVQGSNNDGVWSEGSARVSVTVLAPPWKSWWAKALYALTFVAALGMYWQAQERKRQRAEELARTNASLKSEVERRQAKELALQREKEKAQRYLDVAEVIMLVLDSDGTVTLINQKGARVLGYSEGEIIGRNWFERFVPEEQRALVRSLLSAESSQEYAEYPVSTQGGEERVIAWHTSFLRDQDGRPTGTLSSGTDITEIRRLEEEKESAESASRAKSQFLANMSHEIRTPMNGVMGMLDLLLQSTLSPRQRRCAETARRSASHLLGILNDILDYSKIEAGSLELEELDFSLQEMVGDVADLFAESARVKGIDVECTFGDDLPPVLRGDPVRLRQILVNLMGNAVKFTDSGKVTVNVQGSETVDGQTRVRIEVADTGIGLSREAMKRIFEAFQQADGSTTRRYGGTGLGLSISRQLVEMMGGTIGVESEEGCGSRFWFEVCFGLAHPPDSAGRVEERGGVTECSFEGRLVLLVEDHPVNRDVASQMLSGLGCRVHTADNGAEAVQAVREHGYDLVLMDCQMPLLDGYGATRAIRQIERTEGGMGDRDRLRLPIIAMTAHALEGDRESCLLAGMDDYLAKPFDIERLRECLRRWLADEPPTEGEGTTLEHLQPMAPSSNSGVLDLGALEMIRSLQNDALPDLLQRVIDRYLETTPALIDEMKTAVREGSVDSLERAAHSLKSASGNLGAHRLAALCRETETFARQGELEAAAERMSEIEREVEKVTAALEKECQKGGVGSNRS